MDCRPLEGLRLVCRNSSVWLLALLELHASDPILRICSVHGASFRGALDGSLGSHWLVGVAWDSHYHMRIVHSFLRSSLDPTGQEVAGTRHERTGCGLAAYGSGEASSLADVACLVGDSEPPSLRLTRIPSKPLCRRGARGRFLGKTLASLVASTCSR